MKNLILKMGQFYKEAILFAATQAVGFLVSLKIIRNINSETYKVYSNSAATRFSDFNILDIAILVIIITLFIFFVKKGGRSGSIFFKLFISLAVFSGVQLTVGVLTGNQIIGFFGGIFIVILFLTRNTVFIQNISMILAIGGIGAIFGISVTPITAVILLAVFSVYDIIAVYKTGHMVKMAEAMIKSRSIFGFVIPAKKELLNEKMDKVAPGDNFMILGSGDAVMPLVLSSSLVSASTNSAIFVMAFSIIGLFITHLLFSNQKERKPMAALPPIAASSIIGYLITQFII